MSLEYYANFTLQIYTVKCQKLPSKPIEYLQNLQKPACGHLCGGNAYIEVPFGQKIEPGLSWHFEKLWSEVEQKSVICQPQFLLKITYKRHRLTQVSETSLCP